jgi:hypothetical protein
MARAPKWFPAWRHLWVRLSIYFAYLLLAAIVARVCAEVFGGHDAQYMTAFVVVALIALWGSGMRGW